MPILEDVQENLFEVIVEDVQRAKGETRALKKGEDPVKLGGVLE